MYVVMFTLKPFVERLFKAAHATAHCHDRHLLRGLLDRHSHAPAASLMTAFAIQLHMFSFANG